MVFSFQSPINISFDAPVGIYERGSFLRRQPKCYKTRVRKSLGHTVL